MKTRAEDYCSTTQGVGNMVAVLGERNVLHEISKVLLIFGHSGI